MSKIHPLKKGLDQWLDRVRITPAGELLAGADEMRSAMLRVLLVVGLVLIGTMTFARELFLIIKRPLVAAGVKGTLNLHFTSPGEAVVAYIHVALLAAVLIASPYVLHQMWKFLAPSLRLRHRTYLTVGLLASVALFWLGVIFCYAFILPSTLEFLLGMSQGVAEPLLTIDEYLSLAIFMVFGFGFVFELPLILLVLDRLGVVTPEFLASYRRIVIVLIFIIAAIPTPSPDPMTQCAMALPMYLMFESSILIMRWLRRQDATPNS